MKGKSNQNRSVAVLHVALHPVTGPWSVIRTLAKAQTPHYAAVGVGIISYDNWPTHYQDQLKEFAPFGFRVDTPRWFGTASFLWQRLSPPPLEQWIERLTRSTEATTCVVHFHNAWLSGVFVPVVERKLDVRTVATFHGVAGGADLSRQPLRRAIHRWIAQRLLQHGTALTSVDKGNLAAAYTLFGLPPQFFDVVSNGLPQRSVSPRIESIVPRTLTLAQVGTLNSGKGWRIAAEAVIRLRREGYSIRLVIAGDGPDTSEVSELAAASNGSIEWLGYVRDPISALLPSADLLVLMTANDGLPMAIIEALSCAIPVVSTDVGGIASAVVDRVSGRLVKRDVDALIVALREVCENPILLRDWSAGALSIFKERFEQQKVVAAYDAIYQRTK